mmetsp:Transcript_16676/g.35822  ORF Transcript_16676/g.35822 Transcript_16676/m.35822 type:complete len:207 (+) Transcript_16676:523-1143(+)
MAIMPRPPRPFGAKLSTSMRLPKPSRVTATSMCRSSSASSPPSLSPLSLSVVAADVSASVAASAARMMSMSAIESPSRSAMLLTPREALPLARSCFESVLNLSASPFLETRIAESASVHSAACTTLSPSASEAAVSPRAVILSKARSAVFLIQPSEVSSTRNDESENSETGSKLAMASSWSSGSSWCSRTPRAVRVACGTWKACRA